MAGEMNVTVTARLTADPEIVEAAGKSIAKLRMAHNARTKRGDKWEDDETWWLEGAVWPAFEGDPWPQNVVDSLHKGDLVDITGRMKREPWEARDGRTGVSYRLMIVTIGPSLRRATAEVTRTPQGGRQQGATQQGAGWGTPAQAQPAWGEAAVPSAEASAPAPGAGQASFDSFDDEAMF